MNSFHLLVVGLMMYFGYRQLLKGLVQQEAEIKRNNTVRNSQR